MSALTVLALSQVFLRLFRDEVSGCVLWEMANPFLQAPVGPQKAFLSCGDPNWLESQSGG